MRRAALARRSNSPTRRAGRFEFNAYPAPDAACQRGTVEAGGREAPSQGWMPGEAIMLYNAADLTLAKDARCQTAKRSGYKAAKARKAIDTPPQPLGPRQRQFWPGARRPDPRHVRCRVVGQIALCGLYPQPSATAGTSVMSPQLSLLASAIRLLPSIFQC